MYINLGNLIEQLEGMRPDGIIPFGFGDPMSYRGYYCELAFAPVKNAKVSDMLAFAKGAVGTSFTGYKGGEFTMTNSSECYIAEYGTSAGDKIGVTTINMWKHSTEDN